FSSRRRHTRFSRDWSSDVCSSDLLLLSWVTPLPAATALIPLEHRTAEDLLPAARALLNEGEVLVADGNQLVLRASLERINELREIGRASCREREKRSEVAEDATRQ